MLLLFLVATLSASASAATVKSCGGTFGIKGASLSPTDPIPGQKVLLHLEYVVPEPTITGGTSEYSMTYNFIPFQPTVEPLCQNVPCPLNPGPYANTTESVWPSGLSGTVKSTMKWFDPSSVLLLCIEIVAKIADQRARVTADANRTLVLYQSPKALLRPRSSA
jgi:hypothetical protein